MDDLKPKKRRGAPRKKIITKYDILRAMKMTSSNLAAARYLNIDYRTYRKYAREHIDEETGKTFLELHANRGGKGVPKFLPDKKDRIQRTVKDLIEGKVLPENFRNIDKVKERLLVEGYLRRECYLCGFDQPRALDARIPLLLHFADGNKHNWKLDNLMMLCYNCYFLNVGKVFTERDIEEMEHTRSKNSTSETRELSLDDYHMKRIKDMGSLPEDYFVEDDDDLYSIVPRK